MILALLILATIGLSLWQTSHGKQREPAPEPSRREREVGALRDRYLAEEIELEEGQVADALSVRRIRLRSTRCTPRCTCTTRPRAPPCTCISDGAG